MELTIKEIDHSVYKTNYPQSICLNMIVKNEAHILLNTLINILSKIPIRYWVISDTGSTDGTQELIRTFFKERNIPGELHQDEWKDFGYNRTKALQHAYNKTDYIFIFDADDTIEGDIIMPPLLTIDRYDFTFGKGFVYNRPLLFNNRLKWEFRGVLHEFLSNIDPIKSDQVFHGNYHINSGRCGARNKDPDKYLKDAIVLKNAFEEEILKKDGLSGRYAFYCAQSYKDCNHIDDAIEWYLKCLELNVWVQEKYHSCLMLGELYVKKKDDYNSVKYLLKAIEYDEERIEGVVLTMKKFNSDKMFVLSNGLYHKYNNYKKNLQSKLFLYDYLYQDEMDFENSVAAFYSKDMNSGYLCCKQIICNYIANPNFLRITINNLHFYKNYIENDNDTLSFFYGVDKLLNEMINGNENIQGNHIEIWNILFKKNKDLLISYDTCKKQIVSLCMKFRDNYNENTSTLLKKNIVDKMSLEKKVKVFVSFTTCKRLDLFKQTIQSILNHWTNLDKVDYWFCIDDNSSEEDRIFMRKNYSWIDYYMKNKEEKGHRKSMNIIWNKLHEIQPTYWINIEDDFLFHNKMDYIEEGIRGLEALKTDNVKQVIFNLNYGETIENYHCKSHINKNNGFSVHDYKKGNFEYQNCHYWQHFSFRPGITDVSTILKLGNFNSENDFFEMDYAVRWTNQGYKTGFFNKITCRHIGRLTSERKDPTKKNAYQLNEEEQFNMNGKTKPKTEIETETEKKTFIQIINLEKRVDRKEKTEKSLKEQGFKENIDYQFNKAVDGYVLSPTLELKKLFKGNDFGNRKGVIGCALSHYSLWKQLLKDENNDFYLIMEDDFDFIKGGNNEKVKEKIETLKKVMKVKDTLFLGYHMYEKQRNKDIEIYRNRDFNIDDLQNDFHINKLNYSYYVGGFFAYSLNKIGAKKMIDYIEKNGIRHGIDWLLSKYKDFECFELQPQIVFSEWNEYGKKNDSNIQHNYEALDFSSIAEISDGFVFIPGLDQTGNDIFYHKCSMDECMEKAMNNEKCVAFNTLGFFKDKIDELTVSIYFGSKDGLWVKKDYYEKIFLQETKMKKSCFEYIDQYKIEKTSSKNFCFIHSCHILEFGLDTLKKIVSLLINSGLFYHIEKLFIVNTGEEILENDDHRIFNHEKIKILHFSNKTDLFEVPTLKLLHEFCKKDKDCNVLYLHTKGISRNIIKKKIDDWTNLMLYFLVERYEDCLQKLETDHYDAVGCNYLEKDHYGNNKPHFSGNFWWVKSHYMNTLNIMNVKEKHDAEFFVLSNPKVRFLNLYHSNTNHYEMEYPRELYAVENLDTSTDNNNTKFENQDKKIRIKMLCNWCSSETLCKEWSNMCEDPSSFTWKNLQMTWENENIDYYVIINRPQHGDFYEPSKTIVFQMEPWVNDLSKNWGVKTWGDWAIPDKKKFLAVRGRKNDCWNNAFWQLELTLKEIENLGLGLGLDISEKKVDKLTTICSSKYFDEGHILRIDFLKYIEKRFRENKNPDFELDIYNSDNNHHFENYRGRLDPYINKSKGFLPYKYYFMVENNFEENFITEKLWEPILCETLVFYYGCPNVSNYINPLAYVQLDIHDFDKSYEIIKQAIKEDWWSKRISIIREEKKKILNDLGFFPTIYKIIQK